MNKMLFNLRLITLTCLFFAVSISAGCARLSPMQQENLLQNTAMTNGYEFESLPVGMQADPDIQKSVIELPNGKSFYKAYKLVKGHGNLVIQLRTYIEKSNVGDGFFYPVVELLDFNQNVIEILRPQLRFTQLSSLGRYAAVPIRLTRDVGYVVIRTEPKLYKQEASYSKKHQGSSWTYSVTPFDKRHSARYLPLGRLELLTPDAGFNQPFEKMSGPFWVFAVQKGGAKLKGNDTYLPDMTLGGGPNFSLGYAFSIPSRPFSSVRTSVGAGYYWLEDDAGSDHEQYFLNADILWVESNQVSSLGFGLTAVGEHTYKTGGLNTNYKPAFGPKIILEIRGAMGVSMGAQMSWLSFEDENGNSRGSDQIGLYLAKFY